MIHNSTICAISTPSGTGGIAVIRISGKETFSIVGKIFRPTNKAVSVKDQTAYTLRYGKIYQGNEILDEVIVAVFRAPHSFTGEDVIEISCHGSLYIQQEIMKILLGNGACVAAAGEFTRRAFLNGKLDLAQAEAVADLIASETKAEHNVAMQQMRGGFSDELKQLRGKLLTFVSLLELELDFSEEDVVFADRTQFNTLLQEIQNVITRLIQSFSLGNVIKNGVPVALAGHTNVGKSTLLNALLGEERALVSDVHGTTRDTIEDTLQLNGITFRFIDTAGLRQTDEIVEKLGIARTYEKIRNAAVVLLIADATRPETFAAIDDIAHQLNDSQKLIVVVNKTDVCAVPPTFSTLTTQSLPLTVVSISAKQKQGIDKLTEALIHCINLSPLANDKTIVTNLRHYEALTKALDSVNRVEKGLKDQLSGECIAQDVRECMHYIGEITGEISTDEILGNIFSKFCIGK